VINEFVWFDFSWVQPVDGLVCEGDVVSVVDILLKYRYISDGDEKDIAAIFDSRAYTHTKGAWEFDASKFHRNPQSFIRFFIQIKMATH
jgi:hypothetical protein